MGISKGGSGRKPGLIFDWPGTTPPPGAMALPIAETNVSRSAYAKLFLAIGTVWGVGDGVSTFGLPWLKPGHTTVQASGNVGTQTVGENLSHVHVMTFQANQQDHGITGMVGDNGMHSNTRTSGSMEASGGSANLPAGARVLKCIQYL